MIQLPQTVLVKWNSTNKKIYTEKGYKFTKMGDEFEVDVLDLPPNSTKPVRVSCDICKKSYTLTFQNYSRRIKQCDKLYCRDCSYYRDNDKNKLITEKYCSKCEKIHPISEFEISKKTLKPYKLCRNCHNEERLEKSKKRQENKIIQNSGFQICSICKNNKDINEFRIIKGNTNGRSKVCKVCREKQRQLRRQHNKENMTMSFFNERANKINGRKSKNNISNIPKIKGKDLMDIYNNQNKQCFFCPTTLDGFNLEFDHKDPVCIGGTREKSNIIATCSDCNRLKYTRTCEEFIIFRLEYIKRIKEMDWYKKWKKNV